MTLAAATHNDADASEDRSVAARSVIRMPALDSWRGIAVLWVVAFHAEMFLGFDLQRISKDLDQLLKLGFLAVDFFFVLSGFLITGLLLKDFETKINWKRFYSRRFLKLAPGYVALILVGLAIAYYAPPIQTRAGPSTISNGQPLAYFLFLQNYHVQIPTLAHSWSLAVEEHFYLIMPWLLIFAAWLARTLNASRPRIVLGAILVALILLTTVVRAILLRDPGSADWYKTNPLPFQFPHMRLDALMFGCLIRLVADHCCEIRSGWVRAAAQFVGLALPALILFRFVRGGFNVYDWSHYSMAYLAAGVLLLVSHHQEWLTGRVVSGVPVLQRVGRWSYGIYLWHYPLLFAFAPFQGRSRAVGVGYVCLSIVLGMISTNTLEAGFLRIRSRLCP